MPLTALLCIHNEEARLADCLAQLSFADKIVVLLDRCTDRSKNIALQFTPHILEGAFPIEGDRRNAAIDAALDGWCLEVDADEFISTALAAEICTVIATSTADRHALPVDNYIGGRLVRHGWGASFGRASAILLFKKGAKHWGQQAVHPAVTMTGTLGNKLTNPVQHKVDDSITDMIARLNRYTTARALDIRAGRVDVSRETLGRNIGRFVTRFYKCYVRKQGRREGGWGFLIALMAALFPILSYLKATLEQSSEN